MPQNMLFFRNEKQQKSQAHELDFQFQVTGTGTYVSTPVGQDILTSQAAITQATINEYLNSTNEFLAATFDATAMGVDAFGGLVMLNGQCQELISASATFATGANNATVISRASLGSQGMTASTLQNACAVSSLGNIGFKFILTGLDAASSGIILLKFRWVSK